MFRFVSNFVSDNLENFNTNKNNIPPIGKKKRTDNWKSFVYILFHGHLFQANSSLSVEVIMLIVTI